MAPSHRIGDPARNLAHLIGEAISDDVEAWEFLDDPMTSLVIRDLVVTRDGVDFLVQVRPMSEVDDGH